MGYGIFGYIEVQLVFGSGSKSSCASLFEDRGLPLDATEMVRTDYMERQRHFQFVIDRLGLFADAAEEHDNARLLVWFNR